MNNFIKVNPEIFEKALLDVVDILISKHKELGMKATGDWTNSLEVTANTTTGTIKGFDYTKYLVHGRKPGKRPPISELERWVKAKFGYSGNQAKGMAFAVANKIAKEGTDYHKQGGTDLIEVLNNKNVIGLLQNRVAFNLKENINAEFQRQNKLILA